jgi:riboflavin synthase
MFTGIIEELGVVSGIEPLHEAVRLSVQGPEVGIGTKAGDSIAVNGVCLTVVTNKRGVFTADVMLQTLANTALGALKVGTRVNLERAVTPATRLGGHIVQGHVDGSGEILSRTPSEHWELVRISLPFELNRYLVDKGSITVDGISLTVAEVDAESFTVSLIPETLARTTLGFKQPGDPVNLEVDVIAKYVEKMVSNR